MPDQGRRQIFAGGFQQRINTHIALTQGRSTGIPKKILYFRPSAEIISAAVRSKKQGTSIC